MAATGAPAAQQWRRLLRWGSNNVLRRGGGGGGGINCLYGSGGGGLAAGGTRRRSGSEGLALIARGGATDETGAAALPRGAVCTISGGVSSLRRRLTSSSSSSSSPSALSGGLLPSPQPTPASAAAAKSSPLLSSSTSSEFSNAAAARAVASLLSSSSSADLLRCRGALYTPPRATSSSLPLSKEAGHDGDGAAAAAACRHRLRRHRRGCGGKDGMTPGSIVAAAPWNGSPLLRRIRMTTDGVEGGRGRRGIATIPPFMHLPALPPREYEADGSPKKYRLNQVVYDHKYDWERWTLRPAGVFHTVYYGEFARELNSLRAALLQYHLGIAFVPTFVGLVLLAFAMSSIGTIGIKPKRFTIDWMEASKERDRAENSNPISRYLDRRRQERGPNWMCENWLPTHPYFMSMSRYHRDEELRRKKEEAAE